MATWVTSALDQWRMAETVTGLLLGEDLAEADDLELLALARAATAPGRPRAANAKAAKTSDEVSENVSGLRKCKEAQPVTPAICLQVYTRTGGNQTAPSGDIACVFLNLKRCTLPVAVLGSSGTNSTQRGRL